MRSPELPKSHTFVVFKLNIPITVVFVQLLGLLNQFGWQPPFPVSHFGWWTLISEAIEAGWPKVAAKISNWLGTCSHRSYLSGALFIVFILPFVKQRNELRDKS